MTPEVVMRERSSVASFKLEAVKLVRKHGASVPQASRDLEVRGSVP